MPEPSAAKNPLLTLRDRDVARIRLVHAPPHRLPGVIDDLSRGSEFRRVTLVDLRLNYLDAAKQWSAGRLMEIAKLARSRGWTIGYEKSGELERVRDSGRRIMVVSEPKYPVR